MILGMRATCNYIFICINTYIYMNTYAQEMLWWLTLDSRLSYLPVSAWNLWISGPLSRVHFLKRKYCMFRVRLFCIKIQRRVCRCFPQRTLSPGLSQWLRGLAPYLNNICAAAALTKLGVCEFGPGAKDIMAICAGGFWDLWGWSGFAGA